jgi:hypothetical protein
MNLTREWCDGCQLFHYDRPLWSVWYLLGITNGETFEEAKARLWRLIFTYTNIVGDPTGMGEAGATKGAVAVTPSLLQAFTIAALDSEASTVRATPTIKSDY